MHTEYSPCSPVSALFFHQFVRQRYLVWVEFYCCCDTINFGGQTLLIVLLSQSGREPKKFYRESKVQTLISIYPVYEIVGGVKLLTSTHIRKDNNIILSYIVPPQFIIICTRQLHLLKIYTTKKFSKLQISKLHIMIY